MRPKATGAPKRGPQQPLDKVGYMQAYLLDDFKVDIDPRAVEIGGCWQVAMVANWINSDYSTLDLIGT